MWLDGEWSNFVQLLEDAQKSPEEKQLCSNDGAKTKC